jgi:glycosyltransferase involved in cell wall biosynthesis
MTQNQVSIIITSFNDLRAKQLITQLKQADILEIIIADGGSSPEIRKELLSLADDNIKFYDLPGNIAETRYQVQRVIQGKISIFVDTDELPTEGWLERLIKPIVNGIADFTFGSTKPLRQADNRFTRYLDKYDEYLYSEILPFDIRKGALGNSAWKTEIIKNIGFDPCLGIGGEDYDLTFRAIDAGYRGVYVRDAVLLHDQGNVRTLRRFVKKMFYNYQVGAALAYRKNGVLFQRIGASAKANSKFRDPMEILIFLLKVPAIIFSLIIDPWNDIRYCKKEFSERGAVNKEMEPDHVK